MRLFSCVASMMLALVLLAPAADAHDPPPAPEVVEVVQPAAPPVLLTIQLDCPMAYCTGEDVLDRYRQRFIGQLTGSADGQIQFVKLLDNAVSDAGGYIETFVRMQHPSNPFDADHAILKRLNVDLAYVYLLKANPAEVPDYAFEMERAVEKRLDMIGTGKLKLMTDAEKEEAADEPGGYAGAVVQSRDRLFTMHRPLPPQA